MGASSSLVSTPDIPSRQVLTKYGPVEGRRIIHTGDYQVDAFLGIPFAKPPIGNLRFQKPQPPESWTDILKTKKLANIAIQSNFFWERLSLGVSNDEDCLYLNLFTPVWEMNDSKGFPVMIFVHGGAYCINSAANFGDIGIAKYLVRHGVILVVVQYRLGPLGFLSTGDDVCPGNLGLWDQTFALRWVNENIAAFNGDNSKVTVFGQSAGGCCADLLALSPHSRDLFHQVIPMAGNAACDCSISDQVVSASKKWAKKLKCPTESSAAMVQALRTKPAKKFEYGMLSMSFDPSGPGLEFAPVFDGDFFPKPIAELRKEAPKKKCLIGTAEVEGLLFAALSVICVNMAAFDKMIAGAVTEQKYPNFKELREKVKRRYLSKEDDNDKAQIAKAFMTLYGDLLFNNGTYNAAQQMMTNGSEVYIYSFDHFNPKSFGIFSLRFPYKAPTHCTELSYLFGIGIPFPFKFNGQDGKMINIMTQLWTNFAKFGNPNGDSTSFGQFNWQPISVDRNCQYLSICLEPQMKEEYANSNGKFWDEIRSKAITVSKSNDTFTDHAVLIAPIHEIIVQM